jgi:beta-lactamase class A
MRISLALLILFLSGSLSAIAQNQCCPEKPERQKQKLLWQKMEAEVTRQAEQLDGVMSVAIVDLTSGEQFFLNADEVMPQASSIKITVLLELFHQAQAGKLKLTDEYVMRSEDLVQDSDIMGGLTPGRSHVTLRDLATMMVAVSDNSATNVLIDRVGMENVNATLRALGLHTTTLRRKMMDLKAAGEGRENIASAHEMTYLLGQICAGKALNKEMTEDFWQVLSTHKDSALRRLLPDDLKIADKPGELEGVRTNSAVVFVPNRPFAISVMTTFLHDERKGAEAISNVAEIAYRYFDRVARASEYGRVISVRN